MRQLSHNVRFIGPALARVRSSAGAHDYNVNLIDNWDDTAREFNGSCDCVDYVARRHKLYQSDGASDRARCKHIRAARAEYVKTKLIEDYEQEKQR